MTPKERMALMNLVADYDATEDTQQALEALHAILRYAEEIEIAAYRKGVERGLRGD